MTAESARLRQALDRLEPALRDAFIRAVQDNASAVDLSELARLIEVGDVEGAARLVVPSEAQLFQVIEEVRSGVIEGGLLVQPPALLRGSFAFNGRHQRAEQLVATQGAELVQGIQSETLAATRAAITAGLEEGRGNRAVALEITGRRDPATGQRTGGILGLTVEQTDAIMRARAILSDPDRLEEYFKADGAPRYKLSDRRFDGLIRKAIAGKVRLTAADIDKIIEAHKSKSLKFRGALIAKNEAARAIAAGQYEAYAQMQEDPRIAYVSLTWSHGLSVEPRPDHVAMSGTVVRLGQSFVFPEGVAMKHPHDPLAPARHVLNCRCVAIYRAVPRLTGVNDG